MINEYLYVWTYGESVGDFKRVDRFRLAWIDPYLEGKKSSWD